MRKDSRKILNELLLEKITVIDGPKGSLIQSYNLTEDDFRGEQFRDHPMFLKGNNEILNITRQDIVYSIYRQYLEAGSDVIGTNTFNGTSFSQEEYGVKHLTYEMNKNAALLARKAVDDLVKVDPQKPRFVSGTIGPTKRTISLAIDVDNPEKRDVDFDTAVQAYYDQYRGLIDGGVDLFIIETIFDTMMCKAAIYAAKKIGREIDQEIPLMISATISDASGRLLSGQTVEAFWQTVKFAKPFCIGLNCSLGADSMQRYVKILSDIADCPISVHPNAGLPNEFGQYDQSPETMAQLLKKYTESNLVNVIGGCCGSTPAHIRAISQMVDGIKPREIPQRKVNSCFTGLEPVYLQENSLFMNIGERTNVTGSKKFSRLIQSKDYAAAIDVAREQVENGAQMIDINMDDGMLDVEVEMVRYLNLIGAEPEICKVPFVIDSSKWNALEAGLRCVQGKCIVNSISLKEGESDFLKKALQIKDFGAAVIVMAFDEKGQADTYERKITICERAYKLLTEKIGFQAEDIIFDPNILAIGTGIKEHNNYAVDYIRAIGYIKTNLPYAKVSGGVSNLSFSFRGNDAIREAIHSVFLYHAIRAGMDMGIVNPGQLAVYDEIDPSLLTLVEDLVLNRTDNATDKLLEIAESITSKSKDSNAQKEWRNQGVEQRLKHALLKGITTFIEEDLKECLIKIPDSIKIIEGPLMEGMDEIGDLFGAGKMFLPQVVKSARVMKLAVSFLLSQNLEVASTTKGKILIATVKGDVHDIGKNIVAVILQCNNYEVIDLGVMVPCDTILDEAEKHKVDIIGLSGLITPSLDEMAIVAAEMTNRKMNIPLLIGGATTSKIHTALKIASKYNHATIHVKDASKAVPVVNKLLSKELHDTFEAEIVSENEQIRKQKLFSKIEYISLEEARKGKLKLDFNKYSPVTPAIIGVKHLIEFPLKEITSYIDWQYFFKAWDMDVKYPAVFDDKEKGEQARILFDDAQKMLQNIITNKLLKANAAFGIFPANTVNDDDIEIYSDKNRNEISATVHMLRQQTKKDSSLPYLSLADFLMPKESGVIDYIGAFAVTAGIGIETLTDHYTKINDDYSAIMVKILADRLAEAFAEKLHELIRVKYWGYAPSENLSTADILSMKYTGIRPAPGYPPCPEHSEKVTLFNIVRADEVGISLTETCMMQPAASVSGYYFGHPESRYFSLGKIQKDQIEDYAKRKDFTITEAERWLNPSLAYK